MVYTMAENSIRVLLVEDNAGDARLVREYLKDSGVASFSLETCDRLATAAARLATGGIDVILLDLGLPDSHGLGTLNQVRERAPDTPIIVVTGFDDREAGLEAIKNGAQDYLVKSRVDAYLLGRAIMRQIERARGATKAPGAAETGKSPRPRTG
jgi:DNA-binding response OmpR family regulator